MGLNGRAVGEREEGEAEIAAEAGIVGAAIMQPSIVPEVAAQERRLDRVRRPNT